MRDRLEAILLENSAKISRVESTLRSLTWLLPGRFKDAELASESLTTGLDLLKLINDNVLSSKLDLKPGHEYLVPPTPQALYTRAWCQRSSSYRWAANALQVLRYTQLLLEMTLHRKVSPRSRWGTIIGVEGAKLILRLMLISITRRPIIHPPVPQVSDYIPLESQETTEPVPESSANRTPSHLLNNRLPFSPEGVSVDTKIDNLFQTSMRNLRSLNSKCFVSSFRSEIDIISELLYAVRPLVYVILLFSMGKQKNKIRPVLISLTLDVLSQWLRQKLNANANVLRDEYAQRDRELLSYLLRGDIWLNFSRPKVMQLADRLSHVPFIGVLGLLIQEWVPLIDSYHYFTSS